MTLAELTKNNTSSSDSFQGFPTLGVAKPGNVSKVPLPFPRAKLLAHRCDWWGFPGHPNIGYRVDDPKYIARAVADMSERNFGGAILDWYGKGHHTDTAALLMKEAVKGKDFRLCMSVDGGAKVLKAAGTSDATPAMISLLDYVNKTYVNQDTYVIHSDGKALVLFFSVGQFKIDWKKVHAAFPNMDFIFREKSAFALSYSDGGFAWTTSSNEDFYKTAVASKKIVIGSLNPGFNNTDRSLISWGSPHVIDQKGGMRWKEQIDLAKKYEANVHFLQITTWNDYQEGTAIEPGLDGLKVTAQIKDGKLVWSPNMPPLVDHFEVYAAISGQQELKQWIADPGAVAFSATSVLPAGKYDFYVRAVGLNSMKNALSAQVKGEVSLNLRAIA